jgi:hypothetical protein
MHEQYLKILNYTFMSFAFEIEGKILPASGISINPSKFYR